MNIVLNKSEADNLFYDRSNKSLRGTVFVFRMMHTS